ncbi:MAG: serine/threonine protein kinase [Muribaculaceae bacterium]|nr:serine/threonine protein kinase [Roseburia sp.]MCM1430918.1 serine/threonine protein kinase [Muribaculaceae bacterium]MCM1491721.1 serine/threonine protein kinase [Muribaculaceae bacterium]
MTIKNNFIMSGRYELMKKLGEGSDGTVYLARHHSLELERAIKVFPKRTGAASLFAISEANVLKTIQHPGIPTIYDFEEDQHNYYLVEEYIRGESLSQFLLHQQSISQSLFFQFCEQLCEIFGYLHTLCPSPILYQDLKPEHILICGLQLKLIDFSVSSFLANPGNDLPHFGNTAFSAPELTSSHVTKASDIYSIGRIMQYMADHVDPALSPNILTIIQKATSAEPARRYETADELNSALQQANDNNGRMHPRQTIAVLGSYPGCGATHIAASLTCALGAMGHKAVYYEENYSDSLRKAIPHLHGVSEREGCYLYKCFKGYPRYGEGVALTRRAADISVVDYGCEPPPALTADCILLVCGGGAWHRDQTAMPALPSGLLKKRLRVVANLCDRKAAIYYARRLDAPVYLYPFDPTPFEADKGKRRFAEWLSYQKGGRELFSHMRSHISRLREQ